MWAKVEDKIKDKEDMQVILVTHDGPLGSTTALDHREENETIVFGSPFLYKFLGENRDRILCNIHGHAHPGAFIDRIPVSSSPLKVINIGSLKESEFATISFQRQESNQRWTISGIDKHYLPK